jgi:hypothetical protein
MNLEDRVEQINGLIPALQAPALVAHVSNEIRLLTDRLVRADDEQTRGRIKALRDLINLPEALRAERDGIAAELTAQAASA